MGVKFANSNPKKPIDRIEGKIAIVISKPSFKFPHTFLAKEGVVAFFFKASAYAVFNRLPTISTSASPF